MSTKSLPQEWQETAPSVIGMVSIVTGILGTVQEFLRVNERVEGHRVASLGFGSLARRITVELSLPIVDRSSSGKAFVLKCRNELDALHEQSPPVPLDVVKRFAKRFSGEEHTFTQPDIININSVEVFDDAAAAAARAAAITNEAREQVEEAAHVAAQQAAMSALDADRERQRRQSQEIGMNDIGQTLDKMMTSIRGPRASQISVIPEGEGEDGPQGEDNDGTLRIEINDPDLSQSSTD